MPETDGDYVRTILHDLGKSIIIVLKIIQELLIVEILLPQKCLQDLGECRKGYLCPDQNNGIFELQAS